MAEPDCCFLLWSEKPRSSSFGKAASGKYGPVISF